MGAVKLSARENARAEKSGEHEAAFHNPLYFLLLGERGWKTSQRVTAKKPTITRVTEQERMVIGGAGTTEEGGMCGAKISEGKTVAAPGPALVPLLYQVFADDVQGRS